MREIKFRAWVFDSWYCLLPKEQWDEPRQAKYQGKWSMCEVTTYHIRKGTARVFTGRGFDKCLNIKVGENCILMQYTGLKDKNGKEIYEGDIVKGGVYYGWENETGLGVVKFGEWEQDGSGHEYASETCLGFFVDIKESKFDYIEGSHLHAKKAPFLEIIGNIYENPELLTN